MTNQPTQAQLLAQAGELTAAQRHLDANTALHHACNLYPGDEKLARALSATLSTLRHHAWAASAFAPLARKSRSPADLAHLAHLQDAAGNLEDALASYDRIRLPAGAMADIHVLKAGALLARARRDEARTEIDRALAANPANAY